MFSLHTDLSFSISHDHTSKGRYHEEAYMYLRQLGLTEKAIESGAEELGVGVCGLLNKPFKDAVDDQKKAAARG